MTLCCSALVEPLEFVEFCFGMLSFNCSLPVGAIGVYNYNLQLFTFNCNLSFGAPTDIAKLASTYVI